jgi:release factor glutamine methyltransferase
MQPADPGVVDRLRAAGCVFAEDEARLLVAAATTSAQLDALLGRRLGGLPLEHVLGYAEFCGLRIEVDEGVFVPRRRTDLLARQAAHETFPGAVVVDLCCGSGAVGAVVAATVGDVELHAVDVDPVAASCARRNLAAVGGHIYVGDLFAPLPGRLRGRVDVLVANAPYVPTEALDLLPAEARRHEAVVALDGGADGLDVLRRVARDAPGWLAPRGQLLVECATDQVALLVGAMTAAGLAPMVVRDDDADATVVIGRGCSSAGCATSPDAGSGWSPRRSG